MPTGFLRFMNLFQINFSTDISSKRYLRTAKCQPVVNYSPTCYWRQLLCDFKCYISISTESLESEVCFAWICGHYRSKCSWEPSFVHVSSSVFKIYYWQTDQQPLDKIMILLIELSSNTNPYFPKIMSIHLWTDSKLIVTSKVSWEFWFTSF